LSKERAFITEEDQNKNNIYVVVNFASATMNFAQTIQPITIKILSEQNSIDVCEKLLITFAENQHLTLNENKTVRSLYTKPSAISHFNEVFEGFRELFYLSGTLLISETANMVEIFDRETGKPIDTLQSNIDCTFQLDTQPIYNNNNFTASTSRVGTRVLSLTTYATDNEIVNKALKMYAGELSNETLFKFDTKFKNGIELKNKDWKLANVSFAQNLAEFPVVALVFTN
jgi:hypothetical protein